MFKKSIRLVALALTVFLALAMFAGCKKDDNKNTSSETKSEATTSVKPTEEFDLYNDDGLPKDLDLGGVTLKVISSNKNLLFPDEKAIEESTLMERRDAWIKDVLEEYNFTMEFVKYEWNKMTEFLLPDLLSGDYIGDFCLPVIRQAGPFIQAKLCLDLRSDEFAQYLDFDKPWWDETMLKASTIDGATYCCTPHFTSSADTTWVCFFNKTILEEIGIDENTLYDLQENFKWDWATFQQYCKLAVKDLNGDGVYNREDRWGIVSAPWHIFNNLCTAGGLTLIKGNDDGTLSFNMNTSQAITTLTHINDILANDNIFYNAEADELGMVKYFTTGRSLFLMYQVATVRSDTLREMEDDFGIVLTPMGPDTDSYMARAEQTTTTFFVPSTCQYKEETAAAVQALAYAAWKFGVQDTLELNFLQYTRDDRSEWAVTNVFNYTTYETDQLLFDVGVGTVWSSLLLGSICKQVNSKAGDISGSVASIEVQGQIIIDEFYNQVTG